MHGITGLPWITMDYHIHLHGISLILFVAIYIYYNNVWMAVDTIAARVYIWDAVGWSNCSHKLTCDMLISSSRSGLNFFGFISLKSHSFLGFSLPIEAASVFSRFSKLDEEAK